MLRRTGPRPRLLTIRRPPQPKRTVTKRTRGATSEGGRDLWGAHTHKHTQCNIYLSSITLSHFSSPFIIFPPLSPSFPPLPSQDAVLCGEGSTANIAKLCSEVSRVLTSTGVLFIVSYGVPDNRLNYLESDDYAWTVTVHTVPKPTVSAAAVPDTKDANSVHYVYVCQKGAAQKEE